MRGELILDVGGKFLILEGGRRGQWVEGLLLRAY